MDDLVDGLIRLMNTGPGITGPINLGNPYEIAMSALAEQIVSMTGSRSRIVHRPLPQDDPMQRCPDIAQAQAHLGWQPNVPLQEGLRRTIAYFADLLRQTGEAIAA